MKASAVFLGIAVWGVSLGGAYYLGKSIKSTQGSATPSPTNTISNLEEVAPARILAEESVPADAVAGFLALAEIDIEEALEASDQLSPEDTHQLLSEAFALPASDYRRSRMIRGLLRQLAETDPVGALELAQNIGSLRETERANMEILRIWGKNDPAAALTWAQQSLAMEPIRTQNNMLLAIYRGYAISNPEAAFSAAMGLPTDSEADRRLQENALESIINQQINNGGLLAAKLQIELMADSNTKTSLMREMIDEWAEFDPEGAAAYVASLGNDVSTSYKTALVGEWAESDPEAAAAWLSTLPEGDPAIAQASSQIIREWTKYDLTASAEWLNSLPDSPELDRAVMNYTQRAAQEDPETAMSWAESINSDWMRTRTMERVAGSWKAADPEAFESYLANSDFSDEQKQRLQNASEGRGGRRGPPR